jgi:subtilisin
MPVRPIRRILATCLAAAMLPAGQAPAHAAPDDPGDTPPSEGRREPPIEGRYIVVFDREVTQPERVSERLEKAHGFQTALRYDDTIEGFAARLNPKIVEKLRDDSRVALVAPDRPVEAIGSVPMASGDTAPQGVRRIEASGDGNVREASSENVAVIDTGIDLDHPDLNVTAGKDCTGSGSPDDDNGHGTHVAGTIAAKNNGTGVVGVAPGTKVYAVKVLNKQGSGTNSEVICGIDWVTGTLTDTNADNDITVANMSLGGGGSPVKTCGTTTDPMHLAICRSTTAGVSYVVAAGNDGWDFDYAQVPDTPAAYPEVLTVTAVSDSDGQGGGTGGSPTCRSGETDDRYASFSNYAATTAAQTHVVAGPGVCVSSTYPGGGYATMSGTSMASPHVAGLVALCLGEGSAAGAM